MTGRIPGLRKVADLKKEIDRLVEHYDKYMLRDKRIIWLSRDQVAIIRENKDAAEHFGIREPKLGQLIYKNHQLQVTP